MIDEVVELVVVEDDVAVGEVSISSVSSKLTSDIAGFTPLLNDPAEISNCSIVDGIIESVESVSVDCA